MKPVYVRLNDNDHDLVTAAAERLGKSLQDFASTALLEAVKNATNPDYTTGKFLVDWSKDFENVQVSADRFDEELLITLGVINDWKSDYSRWAVSIFVSGSKPDASVKTLLRGEIAFAVRRVYRAERRILAILNDQCAELMEHDLSDAANSL